MFKGMSIILFILMGNLAIAPVDSTGAGDLRKIENNAFKVGERLTFDLNYGFITAGVAEFHIPKIKRISGREAYHVTFKVNSVASFDVLYRVRDTYETYIDVDGIFPWRFEQHIREGGYTRDFSAFFDQRKLKAKTSEGEYEIPKYVNDIVSAFYYARTLDFSSLKVNDKIRLQNFYKDKVYDLDVIYLGKETVEVDAGKFECIKVEPLVQEGGLFKHEGDIVIWLTNDALKVPVKVRTKIIIGYIDAELTKYENLSGELTSKQ
jgi:hypothetical protein